MVVCNHPIYLQKASPLQRQMRPSPPWLHPLPTTSLLLVSEFVYSRHFFVNRGVLCGFFHSVWSLSRSQYGIVYIRLHCFLDQIMLHWTNLLFRHWLTETQTIFSLSSRSWAFRNTRGRGRGSHFPWVYTWEWKCWT